MKLRVSTLLLSLFLTPHAIAKDQADSLNMTGDAVKVIKKYNGRWKGWTDGCINCDKPLSMFLYKKPKVPTSKKAENAEKAPQTTALRAPISQGYCECNCKPLKDLKGSKAGSTEKGTKDTVVPAKPEKK